MSYKKTQQHTVPMPTITLVGRVNVGKSTLFNKLIEDQKAIISDTPGTTRTNNEGIMIWRGKQYKIIDTGGLTFEEDIIFEENILAQSKKSMKQADVILFVTDAKSGVMPQERELAKHLRRLKSKPILLIGNKADTARIESSLTEPDWYKLGMGDPLPVSGSNGRNLGDALDIITDLADKQYGKTSDASQPELELVNISLIGKPNVGKSSLFNKIIGEDKVIVSDIAHTTREPHDTIVEYTPKPEDVTKLDEDISIVMREDEGDTDDEEDSPKAVEYAGEKLYFNFIDTAGIRRKARVKGFLERQGIHKSIQAMERSDIILLTIDADDPISSQDMQLGGLIKKHNKSVIILVNKWDLSSDNSDLRRKEVREKIFAHFPHLKFAEMVFVSGLTGYSVHKIFPTILKVWKARHTSVANRGLEKFLLRVTRQHRPSRGKGTRHPKLLGLRQLRTNPPIFELFVKHRTSLHRSYIHFLENRLREEFDFTGTPIVIKLTKIKRD